MSSHSTVEPLNDEMHVQEPDQEQVKECQDLELWCLIIGMVGTAFPVRVKATDRVWELQKTIRNEAVEIYGDYNAAELRLFLARKDNGEWLTATEVKDIENGNMEMAQPLMDRGHLSSMSPLADIFQDSDTKAVHVLVPAPPMTSEILVETGIVGKRKRLKELIEDVETMAVLEEELEVLFDVLGQKIPNADQPMDTTALSECCKGYGGFPSSYFARKEELMLWKLVMPVMLKQGTQVVISGSAGVGKSCFLMLVSFYLAFVEKRKVLVVRRLKNFSRANAVIFLNSENNACIRKANLSAAKLSSLPDNKEFQDSLICLDGFSRKEVDHEFSRLPFQLLSASVNDTMNFDDSTCELMLSGWQYDDLLQYAQSTLDAWKKSTGLIQEKHYDTADLVKDHYFYSGGSLRDFCKSREYVKSGVDEIYSTLKKVQTLDSEVVDPQLSVLFDRIRRYYVVDSSNEKHYVLSSHWRAQMDSGYALKRIGRFIHWKKHLDHYQFAQQVRAEFWSSIYEQCFHDAVRRSTHESPLQMINIIVNSSPSYSNQKYDRIAICGRYVKCGGATEEECYKHLSALSSRTYWHPDDVDFPLVDAVVMCDAVLRGSNVKESILAFISITVSNSKIFKPSIWKRFNRVLDDNDRIPKTIPRIFVVVGPNVSTCKRFSLIDAPVSDDFMVCCYNPLQLFRKRPTRSFV
ncbi:unnamed protein product [Peronospora belbahrii]|uniref:Crinkler effector protein N-terminal domain-containing protein n=1 Tax=Peronospora belbahrii TaxID=622444 RepID=A0ABN8CVT5_9STRA|nr:unnamed protein product [Peronospora belbahrii]